MKILYIRTNDTISARQIFAQRENELNMADIKKLLSDKIETRVPTKISRLAYIYIMFADKEGAKRPVNKIATALVSKDTYDVRGDVVLARTNHFGVGAKIYALDDQEIEKVLERIFLVLGRKVEVK